MIRKSFLYTEYNFVREFNNSNTIKYANLMAFKSNFPHKNNFPIDVVISNNASTHNCNRN